MTSESPVLTVEAAVKRYGGRTVLQIDDFRLDDGDRVLLVGQNGSGKSTFLRVLAGVSVLTKGRIIRSPLMRSIRVGYVPQAGGMYGDMTLRENLQIYCRMFGVDWNSSLLSGIRFREAIDPVADLPVAQLSGGTYKLAALACMFALEPDALLLDEPSSELDGDHAAELYLELAALCERLRFLVVSTHDVRGLEFLDRKVELDNGRIR